MNASESLHTTSHFAGGIIYRDGEDGREYLVMEYDCGKGVQIKFPGGTNNDCLGEEMLATRNREIKEETDLDVGSHEASFDFQKPGHLQRFYLIQLALCHGTVRTEAMRDVEDRLSPLFWRTATELMRPVEEGGIFYSHRKALEAAVKLEK